ncbi:hypothetical protein PYCCODRAFT_1222218 [Trametes coccinea BRFM310]|uniref:Uncharacterized protein n=1 Tax=Trametes coccinea (strain BRFM310) TaxID=1353009 RepID=A0A1Y2IVX0_TRAC3|nr:hypothetical protein PYCCODRAFT_1222218 [Trametes coccinea BRFM310]
MLRMRTVYVVVSSIKYSCLCARYVRIVPRRSSWAHDARTTVCRFPRRVVVPFFFLRLRLRTVQTCFGQYVSRDAITAILCCLASLHAFPESNTPEERRSCERTALLYVAACGPLRMGGRLAAVIVHTRTSTRACVGPSWARGSPGYRMRTWSGGPRTRLHSNLTCERSLSSNVL